jgi:UMF1 family MFS transporter
MLVVAITSPILGVIADFAGSKKRFLLFYTILACSTTALRYFVEKGDIFFGMLFFILAEIGYRSGQVFYNSLLPEIAEQDEMGRISGYGWAIGLMGGIVCLFLVLALVMLNEGTWIVRFSLVITAVYFAIFASPIFLWLRERAQPEPMPEGETYLTIAREFIKYIIAFLIYNDGILMMLNFAAIFGAVMFGLNQQQIIIFMIIVQVTSIVGAYVSGWMADRISGKASLVTFILLMIASVIGLFFNDTELGFYIIGGVAGLALSAVQAVSRAMVGILAPPGRSAEFYGFFAVAGRTSSFIGPTIYGLVAAEAALYFEAQGAQASFLWFKALDTSAPFAEQLGQRVAILPVIVFLVVGLVLLLFVDENRARSV